MSRRIVLLLSSLGSGGAERIATSLANAWSLRGDAVLLVATFSGRGNCFYTLEPSVQLEFLADHVSRSDRTLTSRVLRMFALRQLIRGYKADVLVSFLTNVNIAALIACTGLKVPVIVSERSFPPLDVHQTKAQNLLRRVTYPRAHGVVMVTHKALDWLKAEVPRAKGRVIPNPVQYPLPSSDPVIRPHDVLKETRKVMLAVGRLDSGKQLDIVIRAFATLARGLSNWDLVILGQGPAYGQLSALVAEMGLAGRIHILGQIGNVSQWYERADLYVLSSRYEGFPNTLAEAMAHGCAVVSYDCDTGPRDIIRDGVDGMLVRPVGDGRALTSTLRVLMQDEQARSNLSARAIEVRERFSQRIILAQWDRLFREAEGTA